MRKKTFFILIAALLLTLSACGGPQTTPPEPEEDKMLTVEEILATTPAADLTCGAYDLVKYTRPYRSSQIIYNETAIFVTDENGSIPKATLMYPPARVLEVRNAALDVKYVEGTDYVVEADGRISLPAGSAVYVTPYDEYYVTAAQEPNADYRFPSASHAGRYLKYAEADYFYSKQICVTYIRTAAYTGPK
ncbi:hypothetical protein FACS1894211_10750 [Clostridia bacterium]|nr:hypothetical protein FACS1894211_10750 [Clostridia bacterium]